MTTYCQRKDEGRRVSQDAGVDDFLWGKDSWFPRFEQLWNLIPTKVIPITVGRWNPNWEDFIEAQREEGAKWKGLSVPSRVSYWMQVNFMNRKPSLYFQQCTLKSVYTTKLDLCPESSEQMIISIDGEEKRKWWTGECTQLSSQERNIIDDFPQAYNSKAS